MALALTTCAQPEPTDPLNLILQSAQEWAQENFESSLRDVLQRVDQERAIGLLEQTLQSLQKDNIYDLATLKQGMTGLVPLLEQLEETQPYAVWLRTRLDYFDAAGELRKSMTPAQPKRGAPVPLAPPTTSLKQSFWTGRLAQRPAPTLSRKYVPLLKPIFAAEKMPPQLVWLAEVESSFDPRAKSPAGAAGMFQLMKPTAKSLGLSTWLPDERLNAEKSARAAARYLRYLHGRFGDWQLALAAYNAGEGQVSALLKKHKATSFEAIAHRLPSETQMFVPKVEATVKRREGIELSQLKLPKG